MRTRSTTVWIVAPGASPSTGLGDRLAEVTAGAAADRGTDGLGAVVGVAAGAGVVDAFVDAVLTAAGAPTDELVGGTAAVQPVSRATTTQLPSTPRP